MKIIVSVLFTIMLFACQQKVTVEMALTDEQKELPLLRSIYDEGKDFVVIEGPSDFNQGMKIVGVATPLDDGIVAHSRRSAIYFPDQISISVGSIVHLKRFAIFEGPIGYQNISIIYRVEK